RARRRAPARPPPRADGAPPGGGRARAGGRGHGRGRAGDRGRASVLLVEPAPRREGNRRSAEVRFDYGDGVEKPSRGVPTYGNVGRYRVGPGVGWLNGCCVSRPAAPSGV